MGFITLENISMTYGKGNNLVHALNGIDLNIEEGDFVAIMGKSGCGKSTLLNVLGGITKPKEGKYYFNNEDVTELSMDQVAKFRNHNLGFVVQHFALIKDLTVRKNVGLPLIYQGCNRKKINKKVGELLELMEIQDKAENYPYELSGGQCQRVAIARAMISDPKVLLADEPTGALDEETGKKIMEVFQKLNDKGMTIILVTHDSDIADLCKKRLTIKDGCII